jgi:selenocysteine-specific elongation factor
MPSRSIVIGTAGHIDHGKSSLVLALTGTDPDRLKEEKARGITIDLGFAHLEDGGCHFAFVDVPGHERFVRNMLAGAGGIDAVVLVIAADESVMPQTREHFAICSLLQVKTGLIVLTKADLVDDDTLELCRLEARELVAGSFLDGAPIVAVSAKTRAGLDTLLEELRQVCARVPRRPSDGPIRLPVDRAFSMKGFGTVVTGTLVSGAVHPEDSLVLLPPATAVKVRGLQVHGRSANEAVAGQRTAANLGGVDVADVSRGEVLCTPGAFDSTRRADVRIEMLADAKPLKHGTRIRFHQGTSELLGRVALSGDAGYARVRFEKPAVLTRGDRFIVRAYSPPITIGGGTVLDPFPPRGAIRSAAGRARFARLDAKTPLEDAVMALVAEKGVVGLPAAMLVSRAGLTSSAAKSLVRSLAEGGKVTEVGDLLVASTVFEERGRALLAAVKVHHAAQPLAPGLPREEAREKLFGAASASVFDAVVASLAASGRIVARETLALPGHQLTLSPEETRARDHLATAIRDGGLTPPDPLAAAATQRVDGATADRMLKILARDKTLVRVADLWFHAEALAKLKRDVAEMKASGTSRLDVAVFKERYGVSRKFAIPLLEYLDRERVTRRVGDARVIL